MIVFDQLANVLAMKCQNEYLKISNDLKKIYITNKFYNLVEKYQTNLYLPYFKVPMFVFPTPVLTLTNGGYFTNHIGIISGCEDYNTAKVVTKRALNDEISVVLDAINISAQTSWSINNFVFETIVDIVNDSRYGLKWLQQMLQINSSIKSGNFKFFKYIYL